MGELNIRMAGLEDIPLLAELKSRYVRSLYRGFINKDTLDCATAEQYAPVFRQWLETGTYRIALIEHDGAAGNFIVYGPNPGEPTLGLIYEGVCDNVTTPEEKHQLIAHCLHDLGTLGYKAARLWILVDNFRVRFLFESFGFRPDGARQTITHNGQELYIARYTHPIE